MSFYAGEKRKRVQLGCSGKSLTKQEFREECDINLIMKKYGPRELHNLGSAAQPLYGDFSAVEDYQTACEMVAEADEAFQELPSALRARFDNDPQLFMNWFDKADETALDEAGLTVKPPAPQPVVVVSEPASSGEGPSELVGEGPGPVGT